MRLFIGIVLLLLNLGACSDTLECTDCGETWTFKDQRDGAIDSGSNPDLSTQEDAVDDGSADLPDIFDDGIVRLQDVRIEDLPTGAPRFAVSGFDVDANVCVAIVVQGSNGFCFDGNLDQSFEVGILIEENATGSGCWDYGGPPHYSNATGCVNLDFNDPRRNTTTFQLTIDKPNYNKTVRFF